MESQSRLSVNLGHGFSGYFRQNFAGLGHVQVHLGDQARDIVKTCSPRSQA